MTTPVLLVLALGMLALLVINILLSREIWIWFPSTRNRVSLFALLWLVPVLGTILVHRQVRPAWLESESSESDGSSNIASGLLAVDAIFNPGSRHILDAQKKSEVTIRMEGEMYDKDLPDFIDIEDDDKEH